MLIKVNAYLGISVSRKVWILIIMEYNVINVKFKIVNNA